MMDFSSGAGMAGNNDVMPNGQLAWAVLTVRGVKPSNSGGQYIDVELTIDEGQPYARKKVWDMIGDPNFAGNSEAYRQMGMIAITRILEAGRGAGPHNPAGYQIANYEQLSGLRVAIKIGVEKGTGGYPDKNRVADYLTPNPASQSGNKGFLALARGEFSPGAAKAVAPPASTFGGFGSAAPAAAPASGFGAPAASSIPATRGFGSPAPGFQQPQQPQAAGWGNAQTQGAEPGFSPATSPSVPSATTSHSDPTATPAWLAQAGGQGGAPAATGWPQQ
jgi:hypothetical protein